MSKWIFQVICCAFFNTVFYRIVNEAVFQIYQQKIIWFFYRAATIPVYADIRLRNYRKNGFFGSNISTKKGLFFCRGYYFQSNCWVLVLWCFLWEWWSFFIPLYFWFVEQKKNPAGNLSQRGSENLYCVYQNCFKTATATPPRFLK